MTMTIFPRIQFSDDGQITVALDGHLDGPDAGRMPARTGLADEEPFV